jgi:nitroreductase
VAEFPDLCIFCGHCVAECPTDAITLYRMDMDNFPPIREEARPEADALLEFLRMRRSARRYKKKTVPKYVVESMVEAARYAPTGSNAQSLRYVIVQDREVIERLARLCIEVHRRDLEGIRRRLDRTGLEPAEERWLREEIDSVQELIGDFDQGEDPLFYHAPGLAVIHIPPRGATTPLEDATLAAYNMMLMAEAQGVGTCFIGFFYPQAAKSPEIHEALAIPPEHEILMAFTFGYPAIRWRRLVDRRSPEVTWI